jgi:rare lipoprotein A (peptidoglycan hydrolase)
MGYCGLCFEQRSAGQVVTDDLAMNAAHRLGTQVTVCRDACVIVRINDRRPLVRDTDLTPTAARAIGLNHAGNLGR